MLTVKTNELELMDVWFDRDPDTCRVRPAFPISAFTGSRASAVVYFELDPGTELPIHTDSAEEILYTSRARWRPRSEASAGSWRRGTSRSSPRWFHTG